MTNLSSGIALAEREVRLAVRGLTLAIEGNRVLCGVDFEIASGSITALAGPNGAGKSSIVKSITGYYRDAEAEALVIDGVEIAMPSNPKSVRNAGLRVVHQDLGLVGDLSTFDNVALAAIDVGGLRRVPRARWEASVTQAIFSFGGEFDIHRPVRDLRPYERVIAAIARASHSVEGASPLSVLVLDEVTAALPSDEILIVLDRVRKIADSGVAVLFVTHHFDEIVQVADTLIVAREGLVTAFQPTSGMTTKDVANLVFGSLPEIVVPEVPRQSADAPRERQTSHEGQLTAMKLTGTRIRGVDLILEAGAIVGITGRVGSGKSELARLVAGVQRPLGGSITVGDHVPAEISGSRRGELIGYVPQDREAEGVVAEMTLSENLHLGARSLLSAAGSSTRMWNVRRIRSADRQLLSANLVRPSNPDALMKTLSGGNQQKVLFLRALASNPPVIVVDEPTIGVDIVSREHLHDILRARARAGAAILIVSSDVEEILGVADSVVIMTDGRLGNHLDPTTLSLNSLEALVASGGAQEGTNVPIAPA